MNTKLIAVAVILAASSSGAWAQPQMRYGVQGSSFFVFATNTEDRAYNCSISYTLNYVQYGEPGSQNYNVNFVVAAKIQNAAVVQTNTTWAASTLSASNVNGPNCN